MWCVCLSSEKYISINLRPYQYFSKATAEGPGRNGIVRSFGDSPLDLKISIPRTSGGKGDGQNPEQLFAMGYACECLGLRETSSQS